MLDTPAQATLYTVCDRRYFLGLAALRNSLALTNPGVDLVILDCGLTDEQRRRLEPSCRLVSVDRDGMEPHMLKAHVDTLEPTGTIALIDADMIVTRPLDDVFASAADGYIVAFSDPDGDRWFAAWEELLALPGPPRRQRYVNTGFVAFDVEQHPTLLAMWHDACARIPPRITRGGAGSKDPFNDRDQDALNAILMSAVPEEALDARPGRDAPVMEALKRVRIDDATTLAASLDDTPVSILHCAGPRKPFAPARIEWNSYAKLMPRLLLSDDVPVRVEPAEVPAWLRGTPQAKALALGLGGGNSLARSIVERMPSGLAARAHGLAEGILNR